jgi:hypothetical protein
MYNYFKTLKVQVPSEKYCRSPDSARRDVRFLAVRSCSRAAAAIWITQIYMAKLRADSTHYLPLDLTAAWASITLASDVRRIVLLTTISFRDDGPAIHDHLTHVAHMVLRASMEISARGSCLQLCQRLVHRQTKQMTTSLTRRKGYR